jgi:formate hydrogenlyase subunit 6/NADH:ubiquinone oxidoreductase subunit I
MKATTMLGDVLVSLLHRPVTRRYPFERQQPPKRLRGELQWDQTNCTGCGLCVIDCPAKAIEIITVSKKEKRFVVRYHLDRCLFCGQCVQSCRRKCLALSSDSWELAALTKEPFTLHYGNERDVEIVRHDAVTEDVRTSGTK